MKYYAFIIAAIFLLMGCSPMKNGESTVNSYPSVSFQVIEKSIENDRYIVNVSRLFTRRGAPVDLRPENNFIVISNQRARISLAYVGRSYDIRGISGINMTGEVIEKSIKYKKRGEMVVNLKVRQNNDTFRVNLVVGKDGYTSVSVTHPRIDYITYRGHVSPLRPNQRQGSSR